MTDIEIPKREKRKFLDDNLVIESWNTLLPYFNNLKEREIASAEALEKWVLDRSELDAVLEEDLAWRYIKMNIDTRNEELSKSFHFFVQEIEPNIAPFSNEFDKKLLASPFLQQLNKEKYRIYLRGLKKRIELFREKNIPLLTQLQTDAQKYGVISAKMTVEMEGKEITMQKAATYLKNTNRSIREEAYKKLIERRLQDKDELHKLYTHLIKLRDEVAKNADYQNFRDYMFASLGRFDYTVEDCYDFHTAIEKEIVPIIRQFNLERKTALNLDVLKPWDTEVDITGKPPLKPFETGNELVQKTIKCFTKIDAYFADCIYIMNEMGHLDLESKTGKAPGGFNYPLYEIGVPFIYMNAVGTHRDVVTMVHEGGHAIHSFLSRDLEITDFKSTPSEVAELASMSMELISMEHWEVFFETEEELKRAKKEQLEKILSILPWIAIVDSFQHWVYQNPTHSLQERADKWLEITNRFSSKVVDSTGFEESKANSWQNQLHIFEVPFYYIEYGMAQLGAIAMWKNYKENPKKTLENYKAALRLGYTKSIAEIYETAGITFDFSKENVKRLADFVKVELAALN